MHLRANTIVEADERSADAGREQDGRDRRLGRPVALKVLPAEYAVQPALRERFLRETRTAAGFSHPDIGPVYAVEESADLLADAMCFVEGGHSWSAWSGPVPVRKLLRLLQDVGYALAYTHGRGVVLTLLPALALMRLVIIPRDERHLEARFPFVPARRAARIPRWCCAASRESGETAERTLDTRAVPCSLRDDWRPLRWPISLHSKASTASDEDTDPRALVRTHASTPDVRVPERTRSAEAHHRPAATRHLPGGPRE